MSFKQRFNNPKVSRNSESNLNFLSKAVSTGVIIGCLKCKTPFWNIIVDTKTKQAQHTNLLEAWDYDEVWKDLNPKDMKPCPKCGTKEWMQGMVAGSHIFPKPYILNA